jgi:hypothetical protein
MVFIRENSFPTASLNPQKSARYGTQHSDDESNKRITYESHSTRDALNLSDQSNLGILACREANGKSLRNAVLVPGEDR